jgi:hypothetical protein
MKKTAIMMAALSLAVLMSCDTGTGENTEQDSGERVAVSFSTGISAARSVGRAVGTAWDSDDAIGIFMLENGGAGIADNASNRKYVISDAENGSFDPANEAATIYYPADGRNVGFIAYYPYASALQGFAYPVDVSDQTSQAKIDLMTAARVNIQGRQPVELTFKHRLARVELEIKPGTNLTDASLRGLQAAITGQQVTGSFDINTNTLSPSGAGDRSIPLKMAANGKTGQGIILPGEAQAGRKFSFTLGSRQFSFTIPAEDAFKTGTKNKYTITLKGSGPSSSPGDVELSVESAVSAVIEDWGEGITGEGEAEEEGGSGGNNGGSGGNGGNNGGNGSGGNNGGGGNPGNNPYENMTRYKTVPYQPASSSNPAVSKGLVYSSYDTDKNYYVFLLGHVERMPISVRPVQEYNGMTPITIGYKSSEITTTGVTNSIQDSYTNSVTNSSSNTSGQAVKVKAGFEGKIFSLEVEGTLSWSTTQAREEMNSRTTTNTQTTMKQIAEGVEDTYTFTIGHAGEPAGHYCYAYFATSDVYFVAVTDKNKTRVIDSYTVICMNQNKANYWAIDYARDGVFAKTASGDLLKEPNLVFSELPAPMNKIKEDPPPPPVIGANPGIDVWGGKLTYTYKALSAGTISVDLVGGGAGGSGAAAARDYTNSHTTSAKAGRSADGGPTSLYLNNALRAKAAGGAGVNGADTGEVNGSTILGQKEVYKNGFKGNNGQEVKNVQITVSPGDVIRIEVGYGGGGSGGAADNDTYSDPSTGNADRTKGSEGNAKQKSGTSAGASRGGMGAMHGLIFPGSSYPLQKGENSPAAGNATAASGGQSRGAGGAGGDEYATGGMYASGGGGGAAGGFTLKSATVAVQAQP